MPHVYAVVELPYNTRPALSNAEMRHLPPEGLPLVAEGRTVGAKPPRGFIRQTLRFWWWHPTFEHAEAAAKALGELAFINGEGRNVKIPGTL